MDSYVLCSSGRGLGCTARPVMPVVVLRAWKRGRVTRSIGILWSQVQRRSFCAAQFLASLFYLAMAALALHQTNTLLHAFRIPFARPLFAATFMPAILERPFNWSMPTLQSLVELLPPFLLAVPKKKVSHSRKAMRSANKGLKDKRNIVNCSACGSPKLAHHLCSSCYSVLSRGWKAQTRPQADTDMLSAVTRDR